MINYYFIKSEPEFSMWFGINGFRYNSTRRSPSRNCKVRDIGWYLIVYIFRYELSINKERTEIL